MIRKTVVIFAVFSQIALAAKPQDQLSKAKTSIELAIKLVKDSLKDPFSAKLRNNALYLDKQGDSAVCGEFNAKNQFGAYTGFKTYIVKMDDLQVFVQDNVVAGGVDDETWQEIYNKTCRQLIYLGKGQQNNDKSSQ